MCQGAPSPAPSPSALILAGGQSGQGFYIAQGGRRADLLGTTGGVRRERAVVEEGWQEVRDRRRIAVTRDISSEALFVLLLRASFSSFQLFSLAIILLVPLLSLCLPW